MKKPVLGGFKNMPQGTQLMLTSAPAMLGKNISSTQAADLPESRWV